jgi:hypothetical protein
MKTNDARPRQAQPINLSDDEAITLRRVAFGESDLRTLRRGDLDRLQALQLIETLGSGVRLTMSGEEHFRSLPRSVFASGPRQREGLPPGSASRRPQPSAPQKVQALSGLRKPGGE